MPPRIDGSTDSATQVACDVLIVGANSRDDSFALAGQGAEVDSALEGALASHLGAIAFKARVGDLSLIPSGGRIAAPIVAVVGLGPDADPGILRRAAGVAARRLGEHATLASTLHDSSPGADAARACAEGFLLGAYGFTRYKSDPRASKTERVHLLGEIPADAIEKATIAADAACAARDWTNEPAMSLTPEELTERARETAEREGLEYSALDEAQLAERGFGGILGVARGSARPPWLIQLRHAPADARGRIALVGKGITFDSGGLSLKDAKNMESMKTDMAGGAAVICAMGAAARLGLPLEISGYVPATENMPGGNAIKPGDVIKHYGGRTSEVLNTDAEGRLVLADALALAGEAKPDALVDVATLTGAIMIALGRKAAGLFSNDDALAKEIELAAASAGERVWRMPLYDDYRSDLDSEIADIKNTGTRFGGAIYGALFLRDFVAKGTKWAHIDIAGPARAESDYDEMIRGGTGFATRTLVAWLESRSS